MGFLKKAVKKLRKVVKKAVGSVTELTGLAQQPEAPQVPEQVVQAQAAEAPPKQDIIEDTGEETESGRRKIARTGKRALGVARTSGSGINI